MQTRTIIDRISPPEPWVIDHLTTVEERVLGWSYLLVVRIKRNDLTGMASVKVMTPQLRWTTLVDYPEYKVRELVAPNVRYQNVAEVIAGVEKKLLDDANEMLMVLARN